MQGLCNLLFSNVNNIVKTRTNKGADDGSVKYIQSFFSVRFSGGVGFGVVCKGRKGCAGGSVLVGNVGRECGHFALSLDFFHDRGFVCGEHEMGVVDMSFFDVAVISALGDGEWHDEEPVVALL